MHCILVGDVSLSEFEVFDTSDPVLYLGFDSESVSHWFTGSASKFDISNPVVLSIFHRTLRTHSNFARLM